MNYLEKLKELDAAATPGDWRFEHRMDLYGSCVLKGLGDLMRTTSYAGNKEDAELVVLMRNTLSKWFDLANAIERAFDRGSIDNDDEGIRLLKIDEMQCLAALKALRGET